MSYLLPSLPPRTFVVIPDVQAHKWFNLAAANSTKPDYHNLAVLSRDKVAADVTPAQIAEAQKLAREWKKQ
jgi:uncharacterized protein